MEVVLSSGGAVGDSPLGRDHGKSAENAGPSKQLAEDSRV